MCEFVAHSVSINCIYRMHMSQHTMNFIKWNDTDKIIAIFSVVEWAKRKNNQNSTHLYPFSVDIVQHFLFHSIKCHWNKWTNTKTIWWVFFCKKRWKQLFKKWISNHCVGYYLERLKIIIKKERKVVWLYMSSYYWIKWKTILNEKVKSPNRK